jgi:hypothetical protein
MPNITLQDTNSEAVGVLRFAPVPLNLALGARIRYFDECLARKWK